MNINAFYAEVVTALGYEQADLEDLLASGVLPAAAFAAARAYSRYRPLVRRIGDAALARDVAASANVIYLVGGLPAQGDVLTIDADGWSGEEERTVSAVSVATETDLDRGTLATSGVASALLKVTLSAPLTSAHLAGAPVIPKVSEPIRRGVALLAGKATYRLPLDFTEPDVKTLDAAMGIGSMSDRGDGYFDVTYQKALGGSSGPGLSMAYSPNLSTYGSHPGRNPNGVPSLAPGAATTQFRFGTGTPMMTVSPAPTEATYLDFYYRGMHTLASIPEADADALCDYARHWANMLMAEQSAGGGDVRIGRYSEKGASSAKEFRDAAAIHLAAFDTKIRKVPFVVSG